MAKLITSAESVLTESDVTPEKLFLSRRKFLRQSLYGGSAIALASYYPTIAWASLPASAEHKLQNLKRTVTLDEPMNSFEDITSYNNFYELGSSKDDPKQHASALSTDNWSIQIEGECNKPGTYTLEDILKPHSFEERIYRLRCVEAWSMVIPWLGFPLSDLLKRFEPTSQAKYVAFETLYDKNDPLPGQTRSSIKWPYREGLRMDEAMHPLTFMATGLYGKPLPNQNGAPIRLVVPWKYGFKSIKSIVKIRFSKTQPKTSWNMLAPKEYGFYSNVNPKVSHPRWSQARERRIGELFKRKTLMYNGYEQEVAHLYKDLNLKKHY
ncbi:MAG: protein-methionine-sulfoxide reductase catalytic subunit MsrP [Alteromonadaceae bacterium]|nr:MAG: protein-methionine-sulfoxide reductase catalytic subunit MsrP [Alteromonadaceae bacterium]